MARARHMTSPLPAPQAPTATAQTLCNGVKRTLRGTRGGTGWGTRGRRCEHDHETWCPGLPTRCWEAALAWEAPGP